MEKLQNFTVPDLGELYSRTYDEKMTRWRKLGAVDKARNILDMTADIAKPIPSVLEVGSGTGAVLGELAVSGAATALTGIEIGSVRSQDEQRVVDGATIRLHGYDGITIPYTDCSFDLVYATHVLEHVLDERGCLAELRRVSRRYVYLEVPCELGLRTSYRSLQGTLNIGHINAYTPESFALRLETSGLVIRRMKLFDHSYALYRFTTSGWRAAIKRVTRRSLLSVNATLASRLMTYHCGALCERAPALSI